MAKTTVLNNTGAVYAKYYRDATRQILQTINDGITNGLPRSEIEASIENLLNGRLTAQAASVSRTSANAMANNAKVAEYKEQKIERVEWVLADDHDEDDECDDYDGQVWDLEDAIRPPIHYNCKCTLAPVIE